MINPGHFFYIAVFSLPAPCYFSKFNHNRQKNFMLNLVQQKYSIGFI